MSFGDVIRSASSPSSRPHGIGGDANTIWHCDYDSDKVYELSTTDFSVIRNAAYSNPYGIGGDANTIWYCENINDKVYELSTTDFSVIRSAASPYAYASGIGGDANTIWHCDYAQDRIYELSTTDFSAIRSASSPGFRSHGIGGDDNTIWMSRINWDPTINYELSTTDFSAIRSASGPSNYGEGIGGDDSTIWHCATATDKIYELSTLDVVTLSGTISDEFGNPIRDADITISNGTNYTTTTDENGAYSQVVNADTYNIAVSKSRSTYHDITISSVAVTADTTQDITMLLDKMLGRQNAIKGISIPGGISMGRSRR